MSFGASNTEVGSGASGSSLSAWGMKVNVWSLVDLLNLRAGVSGLRSASGGLASGEANLGASVGELRADLLNVGSTEGVAESRAGDAKVARDGLVVEAWASDAEGSCRSSDTEIRAWSSNTELNGGSLE